MSYNGKTQRQQVWEWAVFRETRSRQTEDARAKQGPSLRGRRRIIHKGTQTGIQLLEWRQGALIITTRPSLYLGRG